MIRSLLIKLGVVAIVPKRFLIVAARPCRARIHA
jgi:hypothetical protein